MDEEEDDGGTGTLIGGALPKVSPPVGVEVTGVELFVLFAIC